MIITNWLFMWQKIEMYKKIYYGRKLLYKILWNDFMCLGSNLREVY